MRTFWRLLGFFRPYRKGVGASLVLAALAISGTVAIPWLTGRAIDQIRPGHHDRHALLLLALAVAGAGFARLGLTIARQQTGQLMSRATVDLQSVRFFLGYGLVFLLQSSLTLLVASDAMFVLNPELA